MARSVKWKSCSHARYWGIIFHLHYEIPKVVKYGNFALENVSVNREVLKNSHISLNAAARDSYLPKDMWIVA